MLLSLILFMLSVPGDASDVTRDFFGDIFRMRDCHNGSRCDDGGRRAALQVPGRPCYCQCTPTHLAYREDKQQCVKDIKECYMSVFYRPFTVEAIPLVYLPTSGQLVHPDAHLSLSMRRNFEGGLAKCRVTVSQYLTREGWRTLTKMDGTGGSVFGLFTDANKTYLQFLGNSHDRKLLQQHLALVRLLCIIPQYPAFETCVAIRVGWVPGVDNLEDSSAPSNKANMMVVGLSLGVLALVYIFAVLVYLKIRRQMIAKQKANIDQEAKLQSREDNSDKASSLHRLEASSRLELYHTTSLGRQKNNKNGYRNNCDPWSQMSPIVETYNRTWTDRMGQHSSEFRAQDFKLQPEFFEPEFMASPPHEVLEYLERLQNSITFARHRMRSCYRYQPTLNGIPEDDYFYQELENKDSHDKDVRTTPDGGSSSSVGSLQESSEQKNDLQKRELPKIPPRKPKRKNIKDKGETSPESAQSSDQEQKEIQKAMNTLNDTLDALEYDIYKQEILNQTSDSETANLSCQNSTSIDFDDFETSSCSSMSAITVLGRDTKRHSDISKCSQFMEKNQSEDFSTFSNSTYSLSETMRGLFHDGNKSSNNIESEKSNMSSKCPSHIVSETEDNSKTGPEKDKKMNINKELKRCDEASGNMNPTRRNHNVRARGRKENVNNFPMKRNISVPIQQENGKRSMATTSHEYELKNIHEENVNRNINSPNGEHGHKNFGSPNKECQQRNVIKPNTEGNEHRNVYTPNSEKEHRNIVTSNQEKEHRNILTPDIEDSKVNDLESPHRAQSPTNEELRHINNNTPNLKEKRHRNVSTPNAQASDHKTTSDSEGQPLRKSPSTESMATDMTTDSLDSRCTSPNHPSPTPSLMEMWISKLVSTSVPYSKTRRKAKKKLILPEDEIESWEHVCQKHKDPCPMHDLNDSEPNLIDKLAHYGSKTMAGCDVAGYFQSLKQDVLKEHLKTWLSSNNQSKRHKKGISLNYNNECSHKKPLVNGQEKNLVDENGMHFTSRTNSRSCSVEAINEIGLTVQDVSLMDDSLEPDSTEILKANANIYFGEMKETNDKTVET